MTSGRAGALCLLPLIGTLAACAGERGPQIAEISSQIESRTGHGVVRPEGPPAFDLPPGVSLEDGLDGDECVALALWNNAAFHADLARLGFARADLLQAGLLRNPVLSVLFPVGVKQFEAALGWAVEALWERPRRVATARAQAARIAEGLVQNGLDAALVARLRFADAVVARERAELADRSAALREKISALAGEGSRLGQRGALEANTLEVLMLRAREDAAAARYASEVAIEQLRRSLGAGPEVPRFALSPASVQPGDTPELEDLLKDAFASRPEMRAAELAIEEAGERAGWERAHILRASVLLDANEKGSNGKFEIGPGLEIEIPIFDHNQAGVARAESAIVEAAWRYLEVRRRIASEVAEARAAHRRAAESLAAWGARIGPSVEQSVRLAERAHGRGQESYLVVLESKLDRADARARTAEAEAELRRAAARLDRSVGRRRDVAR